jgi:hypothetical protein
VTSLPVAPPPRSTTTIVKPVSHVFSVVLTGNDVSRRAKENERKNNNNQKKKNKKQKTI